jgi:hypothetical protein
LDCRKISAEREAAKAAEYMRAREAAEKEKKQLLDKLSRSGEEWKPVVFGKWATARIESTAPIRLALACGFSRWRTSDRSRSSARA